MKAFRFLAILIMIGFIFNSTAYAVYTPEPLSGGRFFRGKGTKAADQYQYLGRPGNQQYDDYYYGDGIEVKPITFKPYASYTGEWDSNVFLQEDDEKSDFISRLNWGVNAEAPLDNAKYLVHSGVHSESEWFADHSGENHTDWIYQGGGEANFNYFRVEVLEDFRNTVDRSQTELTERSERNENYLTGLITVPFSQFFQETEVSHYNLEFDDESQEIFDRQEFRVIPRLGFDVADHTQALVEYDINAIDYDLSEDRNGLAHQWSLGARGTLGGGDLVAYQIWGGWQIRNYDSNRKELSTFTARGTVEYKMTEHTRFYIDAHRQPDESVTSTNSYIIRDELALRIRQQITERFGAEIKGGVGIREYSNDRDDFYWDPKVRVDYLLPGDLAHLFAEYRFTGRNSDLETADYIRQVASGGLRVEL